MQYFCSLLYLIKYKSLNTKCRLAQREDTCLVKWLPRGPTFDSHAKRYLSKVVFNSSCSHNTDSSKNLLQNVQSIEDKL